MEGDPEKVAEKIAGWRIAKSQGGAPVKTRADRLQVMGRYYTVVYDTVRRQNVSPGSCPAVAAPCHL